MSAHTLYVCYFGLNEPLVQTQVLPYLRELLKDDIKVSLLTFEPEFKTNWDAASMAEARRQLSAEGIDWHASGYHKRPSVPATAFDILNGARIIRRLIGQLSIDVIHGRTLLGVIMGALARKSSKHKPKLIYDMRGFFAEEYTDAGIWPEKGIIYRVAKRADAWGMREADGFVVLTEKARSILFPESLESGRDRKGRPVEVIPCCIDPHRFETANEQNRSLVCQKLGIGDQRVIVYCGSFGGWYLTDEMFDLFKTAKEVDPNTFIMILTQRGAEGVRERLLAGGFGQEDFFVGSVSPAEVPEYLSAADLAVSFIKPAFSKQASSPTKIAEYLACGLPVISNSGIGDLDQLITEDVVGVLIDDFSAESYKEALQRITDMGDISGLCRSSAKNRFDLARVGGRRYRELYKNLLQS